MLDASRADRPARRHPRTTSSRPTASSTCSPQKRTPAAESESERRQGSIGRHCERPEAGTTSPTTTTAGRRRPARNLARRTPRAAASEARHRDPRVLPSRPDSHLRFDDEILLSPSFRSTPRPDAPLLHVPRTGGRPVRPAHRTLEIVSESIRAPSARAGSSPKTTLRGRRNADPSTAILGPSLFGLS